MFNAQMNYENVLWSMSYDYSNSVYLRYNYKKKKEAEVLIYII